MESMTSRMLLKVGNDEDLVLAGAVATLAVNESEALGDEAEGSLMPAANNNQEERGRGVSIC